MDRINWKKGAGTPYLGVVMMLLAFFAVIAIINEHNLFHSQARTQVITDAATDAGAVAGLYPGGFDNKKMEAAADGVIRQNRPNLHYRIHGKAERGEDGNATGNQVVYGEGERKTGYLMTEETKEITLHANATVLAELPPATTNWIQESGQEPPFPKTEPGQRHDAYTTWIIRHYLSPQYHTIYQKGNNGDYKGHLFLYDYLNCMGLKPLPHGSSIKDYTEYLASGRGKEDGWVPILDAESAQYEASAGKPVLAVEHRDYFSRIYVVVPVYNERQTGYIAVAYCGDKNTNYTLVKAEKLNQVVFYMHP